MVTILNDKVVCFAMVKPVRYAIYHYFRLQQLSIDRLSAQRFILIFTVLIHVTSPRAHRLVFTIDRFQRTTVARNSRGKSSTVYQVHKSLIVLLEHRYSTNASRSLFLNIFPVSSRGNSEQS